MAIPELITTTLDNAVTTTTTTTPTTTTQGRIQPEKLSYAPLENLEK